MPAGGKIAPDGRPPRAKGIGKTARRHDLEQPKTPGVGNSDMQWGDAKRLEQAQQTAPTPKKQNGGGVQPQPTRNQPQQGGQVDVPDAIDFIGKRAGGSFDPANIGSGSTGQAAVAWQPFLHQLARDATVSGPLTTKLLTQLSNLNRAPNEAFVEVIDQNAAEDALRASIQ